MPKLKRVVVRGKAAGSAASADELQLVEPARWRRMEGASSRLTSPPEPAGSPAMSLSIPRPPRPAIVYPDSDGEPMAENTLQYEWIVTIKGNLDILFADRPDVFVAGDLLWYPVEGEPKIAHGRPTPWSPSAGPRAIAARTGSGKRRASPRRSSSRSSRPATAPGR